MAPSFGGISHLVDARILRALADLGFSSPTPVQEKTIPLALSESRDILARAPTGSGKTAAYCIPILQKILAVKQTSPADDETRQATRAVVLVPTRELAEQVAACLKGMLSYCESEISLANVASGATSHMQSVVLSDCPDIVIATPMRLLTLLQSKFFALEYLDSLVIDEADLILSYGHNDDVRSIFGGNYLPKVFQTFLMSATLSEDVETLKGLTLRDPVILQLDEAEDDPLSRLSQYYVRCLNGDVDKFLLTYIILKLKLITGKVLLFVNDVDRCYRLKLFLEQFSIRSCVLNGELPLNSRYHTVQEFNKGVYDYIIATDETGSTTGQDSDEQQPVDDDGDDGEVEKPSESEEFTSTQREPHSEEDNERTSDRATDSHSNTKRKRRADPETSSHKKSKLGRGKTKHDKEYGVTRGIDFVNVSCVLNFDLPLSSRAYTHRIGRTARAGKGGTAISFVVPKSVKEKGPWLSEKPHDDDKMWSRIAESQKKRRGLAVDVVKEYKFDKAQVEAFRYRMEDALRSVTRKAVREARVRELKNEVLMSTKLKAHFEDNPLDLEYLRHDKPLHPTRVQSHMKFVPKYLMPKVVSVQAKTAEIQGDSNTSESRDSNHGVGFVPFRKDNRNSRGRGRGRGRGGGGRGGKRKDPLKKFGR